MKHPIPEVDTEMRKMMTRMKRTSQEVEAGMKHPIVTPVECDNCHRMTQTYNVSLATGDKLCPVCITELSQHEQVKPGPSEVKIRPWQYGCSSWEVTDDEMSEDKMPHGPVVSWKRDGCAVAHRWSGDCGNCNACEVQ